MSTSVKVEVKAGVAHIESGRHRGLMVGLVATARAFVEGHATRPTVADAIALSAGYLDAQVRIKKLEADLRAARRK